MLWGPFLLAQFNMQVTAFLPGAINNSQSRCSPALLPQGASYEVCSQTVLLCWIQEKSIAVLTTLIEISQVHRQRVEEDLGSVYGKNEYGKRGYGSPQFYFIFFFMQYFSRTKRVGSVRGRDVRVSPFQLINLAIMQQDQTFFLASPLPMSETQSFWVDIRNTKFTGRPVLQQETPFQLLPNAAAPGAGALGSCQLGSKASTTVALSWVDPSITGYGSRKQGLCFWWRLL